MKTRTTIALGLSLMVNVISMTQNFINISPLNVKDNIEMMADVIEPLDTLSEWNMFTLALMKVESEYNPDAISSVGAKGYFQITPIYVEEVNRVWGTNYAYKEVVSSFDLSYEVFDLMQKAHNPDYNMKKALELHNGKHEWYNRRVFNAMSEIKLYEEMRNKVKNI